MTQPFPAIERLRLRHGAEHVCQLGPRAVFELLAELAMAHDCGPDVLDRLDRYCAITPETLRALGGDRFPVAIFRVPL